jgi:hypothetical protein
MKYLLKFNESNDPNIELIQDVFLGLEDDLNIGVVVKYFEGPAKGSTGLVISEIISCIDNRIITPRFITSVISDGDYHTQFRGSENFDSDISLIRKYMKYKIYQVSIDWSVLRHKFSASNFSNRLQKYYDAVESYGFIKIHDQIEIGQVALIIFAHE